MIIGITGTNSSGKETIAKYLMKKGFMHYSLSDIIREEAATRNLPKERNTLIELGNELRGKYGEGILSARVLRKIKKGNAKNAVVTSIRSPGEIKELKKYSYFYLLGVDAPAEIRFNRAMARGRIENVSTLQEFIKMEERERTTEKNKQQLTVCLGMADKVIMNSSTIKDLYEKVDNILEILY